MTRRVTVPAPVLPGYEYVQKLGSGGFSDVHLYEQRLPRRRVAVKVLLTDELDDAARSRFVSEANVMAQLSAHPYIVTIFHAEVSADDRPYFVMEYCSGPSLGERYKRERFGVADVLRIGVRLSSAVATAHAAGILHRDIKPANVLTTDFGWPALTDFGIASALEDEFPALTTTTNPRRAREDSGSSTSGSPSVGMSVPWSPPEMFEDDPQPDVRSDVFSLAATLSTLLAGRTPFEIPGRGNGTLDLIARIERGQVTPIGRDDVPRSLVSVLTKGMAKKRSDRFATAVDFARALQRVELELGYSPTSIDVPNLVVERDERPSTSDDETRVRPVAVVQAQAEPKARIAQARGPQAPAPASASDDSTRLRGAVPVVTPDAEPASPVVEGSTVLRPAPPAPGSEPAPVPPSTTARRRSSRRLAATLGVAAAVLIVVIGSGVVISAFAGRSSRDSGPGDDGGGGIQVQVVPTAVAGTVSRSADGQTAVFSWSNPSPKAGDTFQWTRTGGNTDPKSTSDATATVTGLTPGAAVCIDVDVVRGGRTSAEPLELCT